MLPGDPTDVAFLVPVAHVLQGGPAVQTLHARFQVDHIVVPGVLVLHPFLDIDRHAADGVDDPAKVVQVDLDIVVHRNAEEILGRLPRQVLLAHEIGMVHLVPAQSLDPHAGIPGHRDDRRFLAIGVQRHDHQSVGTARIVFLRPVVDPHDQDVQLIRRHDEVFCFLGPLHRRPRRIEAAAEPPERQCAGHEGE